MTAKVTTNQSAAVTAAQNAVTYFPEFGYENCWRLLEADISGRSTTFQFKANPYSTYNRRTHFTPIWYPDGSYTPYTWLLDCWTPAGMLSMNLTDSVTIRGISGRSGILLPQNNDRNGGTYEKKKRILILTALVLLLCCAFSTTAFAAGTGDVAGAVESTWQTASGQIKTVVNNVVFSRHRPDPGSVFFFAKLGTAYFDFRKSGQFEWTAPAILFACLVFTLTAPLYIWQIIGI